MTGPAGEDAASVVAFWREAGPDRWFGKDEAFDAEIARRFGPLQQQAAAGELAAWRGRPESALALVILLDQFPRNMFRGSARAFATDAAAREVADDALARGFDKEVGPELGPFFYLPFMHSEDLADQERCIALYEAIGDEDGAEWARIHEEIIRRFGRFPHRNPALGRDTTSEEKAFLDGGGFAG